jgi:hypothetical protein
MVSEYHTLVGVAGVSVRNGDIRMVLERRQIGVRLVFKWCQNGIRMVLWCWDGVRMVSEYHTLVGVAGVSVRNGDVRATLRSQVADHRTTLEE